MPVPKEPKAGPVPKSPNPPIRRAPAPMPKPTPRKPPTGNKGYNASFMGGKVPQYKKGGPVKKTGVALVHKNEHVVPAKGRHKKARHKRAAKKA